MLEVMNKLSEAKIEKKSSIEGIVTTGDLRGKAFVVYLGESPAKSQLVIGNEIMPCTKIQITVDREKPVVEIKFDCWFVPEE